MDHALIVASFALCMLFPEPMVCTKLFKSVSFHLSQMRYSSAGQIYCWQAQAQAAEGGGATHGATASERAQGLIQLKDPIQWKQLTFDCCLGALRG